MRDVRDDGGTVWDNTRYWGEYMRAMERFDYDIVYAVPKADIVVSMSCRSPKPRPEGGWKSVGSGIEPASGARTGALIMHLLSTLFRNGVNPSGRSDRSPAYGRSDFS